MTNKHIGILGVVIFVAILLANIVSPKISEEVNNTFGYSAQPNLIDFLTQSSTSTGSFTEGCAGVCPVKLLDLNVSRIYAIICNDSNVPVYLTATTSILTLDGTASGPQATSSIAALDGIRLNANGGCYEMLPENLVFGHVWATSTGGIIKKQINISTR